MKNPKIFGKKREKAESLATVYLLATIFLSSAYIIPPSNFPVPKPHPVNHIVSRTHTYVARV